MRSLPLFLIPWLLVNPSVASPAQQRSCDSTIFCLQALAPRARATVGARWYVPPALSRLLAKANERREIHLQRKVDFLDELLGTDAADTTWRDYALTVVERTSGMVDFVLASAVDDVRTFSYRFYRDPSESDLMLFGIKIEADYPSDGLLNRQFLAFAVFPWMEAHGIRRVAASLNQVNTSHALRQQAVTDILAANSQPNPSLGFFDDLGFQNFHAGDQFAAIAWLNRITVNEGSAVVGHATTLQRLIDIYASRHARVALSLVNATPVPPEERDRTVIPTHAVVQLDPRPRQST